MTDRSHLSIGEVLSLLQDEFPDLTITKIRFLEGQGLIAPERTPSGYRKFYEPDIDRLRWILHQQRENFLPLKVIKDRLDEFAGSLPPLDDRVAVPGQLPLAVAAPGDASRPEPVWMADHAKATVEASTPESGATATVGPEALPPAGPSSLMDQDSVPSPSPKSDPTKVATVPSAPRTGPAPEEPRQVPSRPVASPPQVAARPPQQQPRPPQAKPPAAKPTSPAEAVIKPGRPLSSGPSGLSLSFDELLAATGLNATQARALEQFGLLNSQQVGPDQVYADDAVVIARKAAVFFRHGVEARHLRAYKVAADREAGLLEQLILPLLKQRNPGARRQAIEMLGELAEQGQGLHAAFLRQALREHLTPGR